MMTYHVGQHCLFTLRLNFIGLINWNSFCRLLVNGFMLKPFHIWKRMSLDAIYIFNKLNVIDQLYICKVVKHWMIKKKVSSEYEFSELAVSTLSQKLISILIAPSGRSQSKCSTYMYMCTITSAKLEQKLPIRKATWKLHTHFSYNYVYFTQLFSFCTRIMQICLRIDWRFAIILPIFKYHMTKITLWKIVYKKNSIAWPFLLKKFFIYKSPYLVSTGINLLPWPPGQFHFLLTWQFPHVTFKVSPHLTCLAHFMNQTEGIPLIASLFC